MTKKGAKRTENGEGEQSFPVMRNFGPVEGGRPTPYGLAKQGWR